MDSFDNIDIQPIDSFGLADYPAGSRFGPRLCSSFEFVWIVTGHARWICNEHEFDMPTASVSLSKPGDTDSFIWDPDKRTRHGFIHFTLDDPHQVLGPMHQWPQIFHSGSEAFLMRLLNHVIYLSQEPNRINQSLAKRGLLHALLCFIHQRAAGVQVDSDIEENPYLNDAIFYLREQWRSGIMYSPSVEDIARAIGISRGHLVRIFKQETGMSPAQCIRAIRLDHAASLLARSNIAVQEIAETCGFENQFHFSKAFKQQFKQSPRHYRNAIHSGKMPHIPTRAVVKRLAKQLHE